MRNTLALIIMIMFFATVYDKDHQVSEYLREKEGGKDETIEIYNKDWTRKGYIKKEGDRYTIYNKNWQREGYIKGLEEYDREEKER